MTVKNSMEKLKNVILDGDQLHIWNYKAVDSKLLIKHSESEYFIWMGLDLPWPLRIDIKAASDQFGELEDYLQITTYNEYWVLEQQFDMVKITHQLHDDPHDSLPSWFVNTTITRAPYYNFLALKEKVE